MSDKLLKIIFVILILVIIGEGGYYLWILKFSQFKLTDSNQKLSVETNPVSSTINIIPTTSTNLTSNQIDSFMCESVSQELAKHRSFAQKIASSLINKEKGLINRITLTSYWQGKVTRMKVNEKELVSDCDSGVPKEKCDKFITLDNMVVLQLENPTSGQKDYPIFSNFDTIKKAEFRLKQDSAGSERTITADDLKQSIKEGQLVEIDSIIPVDDTEQSKYIINLL